MLIEIFWKTYNFSWRSLEEYIIFFWLLHRCLSHIEMTWRIIMSWSSHLTDSNWSICNVSFNDFYLSSRLSCLLRFRRYYEQNRMLWFLLFVYCLFWDVDFHANKSSRIELMQNRCFKKCASSTFESLIVLTFILFSMWSFVYSLA